MVDKAAEILTNVAFDASVVGAVLFLFALGFAIRKIRKQRREQAANSTPTKE